GFGTFGCREYAAKEALAMAFDHAGYSSYVDDIRAKPEDHAVSFRMILSEDRYPSPIMAEDMLLGSCGFLARLVAATLHGRTHEFHALSQTLEYSLADQKMTDIELNHLRQR